jgi:hypothetical protein
LKLIIIIIIIIKIMFGKLPRLNPSFTLVCPLEMATKQTTGTDFAGSWYDESDAFSEEDAHSNLGRRIKEDREGNGR